MSEAPRRAEGAPARAPSIEWGVAGRPLPGEQTLGDQHIVEERPAGSVLIGVVDGLGHGAAAALASGRAIDVLRASPHEPIAELMRRCHSALENTRGAVMSLAELRSDGALSWLGVGNVEGVLLRRVAEHTAKPESLLLRGGVVGHRLPMLEASRLRVAPGDMLILATDGIDPAFLNDLHVRGPAQRIAERILAAHARNTDDGLVLVARYQGS